MMNRNAVEECFETVFVNENVTTRKSYEIPRDSTQITRHDLLSNIEDVITQ